MKMSSKVQIYGITGNKGHGKDTFSKMVVGFNPNFKIIHFADDLKKMAKIIFDLTEEDVNDPSKKEILFTSPIKMDEYVHLMSNRTGLDIQPRGMVAKSPREILQYFGTEYVRYIEDLYWVNRVMNKINPLKDKVLIPDLRFLNEEKALKNIGAKIIRIVRKGKELTHGSTHVSETSIEKLQPDAIFTFLENDLSLAKRIAYMFSLNKAENTFRLDYRKVKPALESYKSGLSLEKFAKLLNEKGKTYTFPKTILSYYGIALRKGKGPIQSHHKVINGLEHKFCTECCSFKLLTEYNHSSRSWDGLISLCRSCQAIYNKNRYDKEVCTIGSIFNLSKRNASTRKIKFNITFNEVKEIFEKQKGLCYYTNIPMSFIKKDTFKLTIDRINSDLGYEKNNIVLCGYRINIMKGNQTVYEFIKMCDLVNHNTNII